MTGYAELCTTSNFTFLKGASHPEELVVRAADLGLAAIAITDQNSLAGVVRAHVALREMQRARDKLGEGATHRSKTVVALASKLTRIVLAILTQPGTVYLRSKGAAA